MSYTHTYLFKVSETLPAFVFIFSQKSKHSSITDMEDAIEIIRIPLTFHGLDIFKKSHWNTIGRVITYFFLTTLTFSITYSMFWKPYDEFSDQIFRLLADSAYIFVLIQITFFWNFRKKIFEIFGVIKGFHKPRQEEWVQQRAQPLFTKCSAFSYKLCK